MFPVIYFYADKKQTTLNLTKEQRLKIVSAQCSQVKELVTIDLSANEDLAAACTSTGSNSATERVSCHNLFCAAEKEKLREEIEALKRKIAETAGKFRSSLIFFKLRHECTKIYILPQVLNRSADCYRQKRSTNWISLDSLILHSTAYYQYVCWFTTPQLKEKSQPPVRQVLIRRYLCVTAKYQGRLHWTERYKDSIHLCFFILKNFILMYPLSWSDEKYLFCKHTPTFSVASTLYIIRANNTVNLQKWPWTNCITLLVFIPLRYNLHLIHVIHNEIRTWFIMNPLISF